VIQQIECKQSNGRTRAVSILSFLTQSSVGICADTGPLIFKLWSECVPQWRLTVPEGLPQTVAQLRRPGVTVDQHALAASCPPTFAVPEPTKSRLSTVPWSHSSRHWDAHWSTHGRPGPDTWRSVPWRRPGVVHRNRCKNGTS